MHEDAVHYLLKLGIKPNDKANGGCSGLDTVFFHMDWEKHNLPSFMNCSERCLKIAKDLIRHHARWTPDEHNIRATRRAACDVGPKCVSALVDLLGKPGVCSPEVMAKLVGTDQMQDMLKRSEQA
jgi:hypothetical protein